MFLFNIVIHFQKTYVYIYIFHIEKYTVDLLVEHFGWLPINCDVNTHWHNSVFPLNVRRPYW